MQYFGSFIVFTVMIATGGLNDPVRGSTLILATAGAAFVYWLFSGRVGKPALEDGE